MSSEYTYSTGGAAVSGNHKSKQIKSSPEVHRGMSRLYLLEIEFFISCLYVGARHGGGAGICQNPEEEAEEPLQSNN